MHLLVGFFVVISALRGAQAQRPSNLTICDYYAELRYGDNNATTQFKLMQSIVALAFGGGRGVSGTSPDSTGILNPGTFDGEDVNLRSWFDGNKATTNLNNQPVGINWLDGGAQAPLMAFLNGSVPDIVISNTTNQYRLFTHFNTAFGFVFGCTLARQFPKVDESGGPIALAYVHKFMNLNQTHLGHFIDQLTTASRFFGFSDTDANTLETAMNAKYNVRCSPASNGQLNSLCQAAECPLAAPSADCDAYRDLGPNGPGNGTSPTASPSTATTATTATVTATGTSSNTTPAATTDSSSSKSSLSSGAIAGIAIGGAVVLLLALGLFLFWRRHARKKEAPAPVPSMTMPFGEDPYTPSHVSYLGSNPHSSYLSQPSPVQPHESFATAYHHGASPPPPASDGYSYRGSPPPGKMVPHEIAEMDSSQHARGSTPGPTHEMPSPMQQPQREDPGSPTLPHGWSAGGRL